MDEAFDVGGAEQKAALDHHVFFSSGTSKTCARHPSRSQPSSVVMWSIGNEIVEQNDSTAGPAWPRR